MKERSTLCLLIAIALLLNAFDAPAAIFNIANGDVAGLKSAITTSNTNGGDDTINLAAGGEYILLTVDNTTNGENGLPVILADSGHSLLVNGNGSVIRRDYVQSMALFRILQVGPGANVTLKELQLSALEPPMNTFVTVGAALFNNHGTVVLESCSLYDNWANTGGAIYSDGSGGTASLTLVGCELFQNHANGRGGAIHGEGTKGNASVVLMQSHIYSNVSEEVGGGISSVESALSITGGSIDYNVALDWGGGISHTGNQSGATLSAVDLGMVGNHAAGFGGGIYQSGAQLTLTGCNLEENYAGLPFVTSAAQGGGLFHAAGNATLSNCTFRRNWNVAVNDFPIQGGAIYNAATLGVSNTTFLLNRVQQDGGAVYNAADASLVLDSSTFSNNTAAQYGGGLYSDGIVTGTNSTFTGNSGLRGGGLISRFAGGAAMMTLRNCTITNNTATDGVASPGFGGGGVFAEGNNQQYFAANNIIAGNSSTNDPDVRGNYTSDGHNLIGKVGDSTGFSNGVNGDIVGTIASPVNAQFGTFANHGGPTDTWSLLNNSAAINAGNDANAPPRDQRYYARSGVSDIGAFEFGGTLAPLRAVSRKIHSVTAFDIPLPLIGPVGVECRRNTGADTNTSPNFGHDHQVIITFATPISFSGVNVTTDQMSDTPTATSSVSGNIATIDLHAISNPRLVTITLMNVSDGSNANNVNASFGVLAGDTTGNGSVNATDVSQTKLKSGQAVDVTNFRNDVTVSNSINATDVSLIKLQSGTALP